MYNKLSEKSFRNYKIIFEYSLDEWKKKWNITGSLQPEYYKSLTGCLGLQVECNQDKCQGIS